MQNVENASLDLHISKHITAHILERNHTHAQNVENASLNFQVSEYITAPILERNHTHVLNVGSASLGIQVSETITAPIPERNVCDDLLIWIFVLQLSLSIPVIIICGHNTDVQFVGTGRGSC